jgi:hypothetical protein
VTIRLRIGQAVQWPPAPDGVAQIEEILRRRVRLVYRTRRGTLRHPLARPEHLMRRPMLLEVHNPLGRAIGRPREKEFVIERSA